MTGVLSIARLILLVAIAAVCVLPARALPADAGKAQPRTAAVLGGGGLVGMAWEAGVVKGLSDSGVDLNRTDLIVGTSAGAVLGTRIRAGESASDIYGAAVYVPPGAGGLFAGVSASDLLEFFVDPDIAQAATRAELVTRALSDYTIPNDQWLQIAALLTPGITTWPSEPLEIAAVDAFDGLRALFDANSRPSITEAVAASTAVPLAVQPIAIGGQRYMDGGVDGTNIDAAEGYDVIAIIPYPISPITGDEIEKVRASGGRVLLIQPDSMLALPFDVDQVANSGSAGIEVGVRVAPQVASFLGSDAVAPSFGVMSSGKEQ
jgi:NTE family protein